VGRVTLRQELDDSITLRRSTLFTMLDTVERTAAVAKHAVMIAITARDAFEAEERRLNDCARQLDKMLNKR
jgi:hypothetical protein